MEMIVQSSSLEYLESREMGESAFCEKYKVNASLSWAPVHLLTPSKYIVLVSPSFHPPKFKISCSAFPLPKMYILCYVSGGFDAQI